MKNFLSACLVLTVLAEPAFGSDEVSYICPLENLSSATYKVFSQKKDSTNTHQMMVIDCYEELLDITSKNPDPRVTADVVALGKPRGTQLFELYSEFLESLVLQYPQRLLDALLLVNQARVVEVVKNLRDPLVSDKKDIDASINRFHEDPRYGPIVELYLSEEAD